MKNAIQKTNRRHKEQSLRFTPYAWAKLTFMRDMTESEVGGFGITEADDTLLVTDIVLVKQKVTDISVAFDDDAVANFFEDQVDADRVPEQFARIWLHTHPGISPQPSFVDEETFQRVFGFCNWSVMVIVAQNDSAYARLRFGIGPGGEVEIPVCIDYACEFEATDFENWGQEYEDNVTPDLSYFKTSKMNTSIQVEDIFGSNLGDLNLLDEIDSMDPTERQYFMEELAIRSDFWDESEVLYE